MKPKKIVFLVLGLFLLGLYAVSGLEVREQRRGRGHRFQFNAVNLPPTALKVLAGEFKGLMADYLLLSIQSFIGSNQAPDRAEWLAVARAFDQSQALDPYFEQTYLMAQGLLSWEAGMPDRAVTILERAAKHRPWDWRAEYYAGFIKYYFLNDFQGASEAFLQAAKVPHSPEILPVLGARLAQKSGRTEWALRLLQAMFLEKQAEGSDTEEIEKRIQALQGVLMLERAVAAFHEQTGRWPKALNDLILTGILTEIPENPYGGDYFWNPETRTVSFDQVKVKVHTGHGPFKTAGNRSGPGGPDLPSWTPMLDAARRAAQKAIE